MAILGIAFLIRGFRDRSLRGMGMVLAGGYLLARGALGGRPRIKRAVLARTEPGRPEEDDLTETSGAPTISRSITVGKPADELYETWRDPDRFSQIMGHVGTVTEAGEDRLRWTVRGPRDRDLSWETHVVEDVPGTFLRWKTPEDAVLPNEGSIRFRDAPGDRGSQVTLSISFDPPGGALGNAALKRLDIAPETLAGEALRRFKQLAETEEIPTLDGNPSARGEGDMI